MTDGAVPVRGRILVVDDQAPNRQLLHDLLALDGHDVIEAHDGATALALAAQADPDVILLDVTMPGLDGFEVCRRLRALPATAATPILLVTALGERANRLEGMSSGANDYLVKPIDRNEVSLRVRNAVRMRMLHRALDERLRALQRLERLRDELVAMLVHDFRSPLTGVRGYLGMIQGGLDTSATTNLPALVDGALAAVGQLDGMIGDLLDVSRLEAAALPLHRVMVDALDAIHRAVGALGPRPSVHDVPVRVTGDRVWVSADAALLQRVLVNLLSNAIRFSPAGAGVDVSVVTDNDRGLIRIHDAGPGIEAHELPHIFDKFHQGPPARGTAGRGAGLGLTFCRLVVEAHGGQIGVTSAPGAGSEFWVTLPSAGAGASP